MAQDLASFISQKGIEYGERTFLIDCATDRRIAFQDLDTITDRLAGGFIELGIQKNDHVALLHPNHSDFILGYLGIIKAGAVAVPINTMYPPPEIAYIIQDAKATVLVTTDELHPRMHAIAQDLPSLKRTIVKKGHQSLEAALGEELGELRSARPVHADPDDVAIMFYTSGTTGKPKGVMITHRNLTFSGPNIAQSYGLQPGDRTIAALPLVHVFANASPVFGSLSAGGSVVVMERFQTEMVFEAIERYGVTWFPGVPTMFHYLLAGLAENRRNLTSLSMLLSGGASLPVEALRSLEQTFRAKVLEVYGLTESTGLVTANPVYGVRKPGSIGVAVSGVEARIIDSEGRERAPGDVGELVFRGPNACRGYWNLPQQTTEKIKNGWVHTGDHACKDEDGYYFIVGREKELIITGGFNIYPREIEEILHRHPDVHEAAVIGVAHAQKGEIPKAFVVLKPGAGADAEALRAFCRQHLAPYKVPQCVLLDELPKNATGKIMKNRLV